jgi:hypothetical protein
VSGSTSGRAASGSASGSTASGTGDRRRLCVVRRVADGGRPRDLRWTDELQFPRDARRRTNLQSCSDRERSIRALSGHRVPLVQVTTWRADHRVVGAKRSNKSPMAGELVGA